MLVYGGGRRRINPLTHRHHNPQHANPSKLALPQFQGSFPEILLTDTVGFIQKLPTQLIAAFRATLEVGSVFLLCVGAMVVGGNALIF